MMDPSGIVFLLTGLILGAGAAWLVLRGRAAEAALRERTEAQVRLMELETQLRHATGQLEEARAAATAAAARIEQLQAESRAEAERRAAAEEKNARIPALERELQLREDRLQALQADLAQIQARLAETQTTLVQERQQGAEKLALLDDAERKLADTFKALAAQTLSTNNESFLTLARQSFEKYQETARGELEKRQQAIGEIVRPLSETLKHVDEQMNALEKSRIAAFADLGSQLTGLTTQHLSLQRETANLVNALRAPQARGRWGEIQLRLVVEIAGMVKYCDFDEQASVSTDDGWLRPDMIIRLPNQKNIVVDSKVPLKAYLDALDAPEAERRATLAQFARHVRDHIDRLGAKDYWRHFDPTPELVVLFLPGENFFSAALEQLPDLIEYGMTRKIIIATPTTLIALLRAVAYGWRQEQLAENASQISELGRELHDRVRILAEHFAKLGNSLDSAVGCFNSTVASFESRVLPQARRFKELGAAGDKEIAVLAPVEREPRKVQPIEIPLGAPASLPAN